MCLRVMNINLLTTLFERLEQEERRRRKMCSHRITVMNFHRSGDPVAHGVVLGIFGMRKEGEESMALLFIIQEGCVMSTVRVVESRISVRESTESDGCFTRRGSVQLVMSII